MNKEQELHAALTIARAYVEQAVKDDGGIDNCEIGDRLAIERIDAALARRSSDEQAEVVGDEAMLAAVGAISELEDAILDCRTLDDLAELQTAARRRRESDLAIFNRGIALAQARLSARDEPISPGLQAAIDHTKAKIRAAFSGVTPSPAVAAGGVTEARAIVAEMVARNERNGFLTDWWRNKLDALSAALAVGDEGMGENAFAEFEGVTAAELAATVARYGKALVAAKLWHEAEDKSLSKQPPTSGPNGSQWARLQHQEQIAEIDAALSPTPPSRGEGV